MRYPPAIRYTPARSRVYLTVVALITIVLIALCAYSMPARGHFSFKNYLFIGLAASASLWLLRDAFKQPRGQLQYAQGQWVWQQDGQETAGTCALHLDLQNYLLVSFKAQGSNDRFFIPTTQWFHLEARHVDQATWGMLRRAVYAQASSSDEAVAL